MNQSALSLNFSALDPASRGANLPTVLGGKQGQRMDLKSQISAIINGRSRRLTATLAQSWSIEAAEAEACAQSGFDEVEAKWNDATSRENEAEDAIFACEPRTAAGALALLRFVADYADNFFADNMDTAGAIRRALEVLEANGRV